MPPTLTTQDHAKKQTSLFGYFKKVAEPAAGPVKHEPASTPIRSALPSNGLPTPVSPLVSVPIKAAPSSSAPSVSGEDEDESPRFRKRRRKVVEDDDDFTPAAESPPQSSPSEEPTTNGRQHAFTDFRLDSEVRSNRPNEATLSSRAHRPPPSTKPSGSKETRYDWLIDIRDANGNRPDNPSYDSRTLFIPKSAWDLFTPFEKQFWEIKQKLWDTALFFKKGKFYELYEHDADIGHTRFSLKMTDRVNMRMVGVPESSFEYWCAQFIGAGYKVARVDQKETALGASMRNAKAEVKSKDKLVQRELSCVLTAGTLTDEALLSGADAMYIMAIVQADREFGVAFADASTARFFIASVCEDAFSTLLAQIRPREIVVLKGEVNREARKLVKLNTTYETIWNELLPGETCDPLAQGYWDSPPPALTSMDRLSGGAFGLLTWYLKSLNIDRDLLPLGNVSFYHPNNHLVNMLMDGQTLNNLEIFQNTYDGSTQGTLWSVLDRCISAFGKRLLKEWVCRPLSQRTEIERRLDAVELLNGDLDLRDEIIVRLRRLPDLERLISRIHAGRARITDFCKCLDGFEALFEMVEPINVKGMIGELKASCPDMNDALIEWQSAFDRVRAMDEQVLIPAPGFDADYDAGKDKIADIEQQLQNLLETYRKEFGKKISFRDIGKDTYLIEVPASIPARRGWEQTSSTKAAKRYSTAETRPLVRKMNEALEEQNQLCETMKLKFYKRFDEHYTDWLAAVKAVGQIDCLVALSLTSSALQPCVRPDFLESQHSVVEFKDLRHPCAERNEFVENDVRLGGEAANLVLLTGANAAGKSTLLRTTCISVVLAQIGCYVPASSARLSIVDRIMSRLGANDNIFANQSTFFVELNETKRILEEATPRSLVILDELGRGTSTYDGLAIASAVLWHIASHIGCLGFFATHYATLANEFSHHRQVRPMRMAVQVDENNKVVTFLYRLEDGVSLKSYGMHVANMCGIPRSIIDRAEKAADAFEAGSKMYHGTSDSAEVGRCTEIAWLLNTGAGHQHAAGEAARVFAALM